MAATPAIGAAEVRDRQLIQAGESGGQFAFAHAPIRDEHGPQHRGMDGQVIDVPAERFVGSTVAFNPHIEIPLGTAGVEVQARGEPEAAELPHANASPLRQMEDRDVRTTLHHISIEGTTPRACGQPTALPTELAAAICAWPQE